MRRENRAHGPQPISHGRVAPVRGIGCRLLQEAAVYRPRSPGGFSDTKGVQMSTVTEPIQMAPSQTQNGPQQTPPAEASWRSRRPQERQRVVTRPQDVVT